MNMTYPFTTQSLVFDGCNVTFSTFQLNTLAMWQQDAKQRLQNLCWLSEDQPLLQFDDRGDISDVNEHTLGLLLKFLLLETSERGGIDLRPYLPEHESPRHKTKQFNHIGEEHFEPFRPERNQYPANSTYYYSHIP